MMHKIIPSNMKNIVTKSVVARKLKTAFFILVFALVSKNTIANNIYQTQWSYDPCTGNIIISYMY